MADKIKYSTEELCTFLRVLFDFGDLFWIISNYFKLFQIIHGILDVQAG